MKTFKTVLGLVVLASLLLSAVSVLAVDDVVWVELWNENVRNGVAEKGNFDHPQVEWMAKEIGVGYYQSEVLGWNGGQDYYQKLNLRIAGGSLPDMFMPWFGIESELIKQGAVVELSDYLPKYAPHVWEKVPEGVWNAVRSYSPDGKGIYFVPNVFADAYCSGFIRQDWLDRLGLDMPTTIAEYEAVLRAFKDQDANGNGDPNDEIPTMGRENGRWMDHLFAPFGVAMYEGIPDWDLYDGTLQYAGVQPEMKAALEWAAKLYAEGLLDQETFLNTGKIRDAKIGNDQAGSYYHGPSWQGRRIPVNVNPEAHLVVLPVLKAEGYEGFYSDRQFLRPQWMFAAGDEDKLIAGLKILEIMSDPAYLEHHRQGYEGLDYKIEDGQEVRLGPPADRFPGLFPSIVLNTKEQTIGDLEFTMNEENKYVQEQVIQLVKDSNAVARRVVTGQGMPSSVYDEYPDILGQTLYYEYAARIITGKWSIDKFDEFVERWNKSGGGAVTKSAQEWYATTSGQ